MDFTDLDKEIKSILQSSLLCKRCQIPTDLKVLTLLDMSSVRLCTDCLTDYHYFLLDHPIYKDIEQVDSTSAYLDRKGKRVSRKECEEHCKKINTLRRKVRPFIKEFLEGKN